MSDSVIKVENVSKAYRLGQIGGGTLREDVSRWWATLRGQPDPTLKIGQEHHARKMGEQFWALDNVSFEVKEGEVLGIIGRNGAGKSTLLKILSQVTTPTSGEINIRGRIASLLEVGTGFHPELNGRENIFLNGAILGMTKAEIRNKFDEIVAFSGVEEFIDTPVKRYSSGMYVRLAFAVAAHLEPEILIVDEVLAVGDMEFQKKCLGKMREISKGGRTVLFVSHNMDAVNRLCERAVLFESGRIKADGDTHSITGQYLASDMGIKPERHWEPDQAPGDDVARLIQVRVLQQGEVTESVDIRYPVDVEMTYENRKAGAQLLAALAFFDSQGVFLFAPADFGTHKWAGPRPPGVYRSLCRVPGNLFSEGAIRVYVEVSTRHPVYQIHVNVHDCVGFQVVDTGAAGNVRAGWGRPIPGALRPLCEWQTSASGNRIQVGKPISEETVVK